MDGPRSGDEKEKENENDERRNRSLTENEMLEMALELFPEDEERWNKIMAELDIQERYRAWLHDLALNDEFVYDSYRGRKTTQQQHRVDRAVTRLHGAPDLATQQQPQEMQQDGARKLRNADEVDADPPNK